MTSTYLWAPPPVYSLPVRGQAARLPVNRLFFVGRNYHAHAVEMGRPVDKSVERPFYFTKSPSSLVESGATVAYPPETTNYHHEMELVVAIGRPGFRVTPSDAGALIYGYACGLDMTRRDLQLEPQFLGPSLSGDDRDGRIRSGSELHLDRQAVYRWSKDAARAREVWKRRLRLSDRNRLRCSCNSPRRRERCRCMVRGIRR